MTLRVARKYNMIETYMMGYDVGVIQTECLPEAWGFEKNCEYC